MKIGFIGTGAITTAMVEGLCKADAFDTDIVVSPRNIEKSKRLASRFDQVSIAENNQAVVDRCDCVVLSVVPGIAKSVLEVLNFRKEQKIISVIAIMPISEIKSLVGPAEDIIRSIPLPTAEFRQGPIALYPHTKWADDLFKVIGDPVAVSDENELNVIAAITALIAPYYALIESVCRWGVAAGLDANSSGSYVGSMFKAISTLAQAAAPTCFENLAQEASTPGGLNEQALEIIKGQKGYELFTAALDAVLARLRDESIGY
jgi:pyrroline-5-carboxylate reductase